MALYCCRAATRGGKPGGTMESSFSSFGWVAARSTSASTGEYEMTDLNVSSVHAKGRAVLETFDYDGVRLLPGRLEAQVRAARNVYGSIPNDSILKGFRRENGLPAPGEDLRGWCKTRSAVIFGQLLSGLARLGRATGDRSLWDKANALLAGWHETLPADGNLRLRPYDWEKLVCGLVDLHHYAGSADALPILRQITEQ